MPELFGISIEVYVIVPLLGIPVFFLWRGVFRKSRQKLTTKIGIWLLTIITAPMIYVCIMIIALLVMDYYPNRDFVKQQWLTNKDKRYEYSKDIIQSKILIGKTKKEVKQILGDDSNSGTSDDWYYDLGYRPELANIDPDNLEITFKNGRVNDVVQHER